MSQTQLLEKEIPNVLTEKITRQKSKCFTHFSERDREIAARDSIIEVSKLFSVPEIKNVNKYPTEMNTEFLCVHEQSSAGTIQFIEYTYNIQETDHFLKDFALSIYITEAFAKLENIFSIKYKKRLGHLLIKKVTIAYDTYSYSYDNNALNAFYDIVLDEQQKRLWDDNIGNYQRMQSVGTYIDDDHCVYNTYGNGNSAPKDKHEPMIVTIPLILNNPETWINVKGYKQIRFNIELNRIDEIYNIIKSETNTMSDYEMMKHFVKPTIEKVQLLMARLNLPKNYSALYKSFVPKNILTGWNTFTTNVTSETMSIEIGKELGFKPIEMLCVGVRPKKNKNDPNVWYRNAAFNWANLKSTGYVNDSQFIIITQFNQPVERELHLIQNINIATDSNMPLEKQVDPKYITLFNSMTKRANCVNSDWVVFNYGNDIGGGTGFKDLSTLKPMVLNIKIHPNYIDILNDLELIIVSKIGIFDIVNKELITDSATAVRVVN